MCNAPTERPHQSISLNNKKLNDVHSQSFLCHRFTEKIMLWKSNNALRWDSISVYLLTSTGTMGLCLIQVAKLPVHMGHYMRNKWNTYYNQCLYVVWVVWSVSRCTFVKYNTLRQCKNKLRKPQFLLL